MKLKPRLLTAIIASIIVLGFYACRKQSADDNTVPAGMNKLSVYLTDGPTDYQKVLIDIRGVAIKVDSCHSEGDEDHEHQGWDDDHDHMESNCERWDTLAIHPGIYDLLTLRNGIDTLLAGGFVPNGKIERIKLMLGSNNSVLVDGLSHPLNLVNNQDFIYINVKRENLDSITPNNLRLFLDFNLDRSIKYNNGQYWLKPVLMPFSPHTTGVIEGKVRPVHSFGMMKAYNNTDSANARPEDEGEFRIRGLREGTYNLFIQGVNGYHDSTLHNIIVHRNGETNLGTIQLHQ